jgi:hypothetical protein
MAVNYQMDVINPFQAALQGYGAGAQMLQQEQQGAQQARQAQMQETQFAQQSQLFGMQMQEAEMRAQRLRDEQAAAQAAQAANTRVFELMDDPDWATNVPSSVIAQTLVANPELGKFIQAERQKMNDDQKLNSFNLSWGVAAALELKNVPEAKRLLEQRAVALENSGETQQAALARGMIEQLNTPAGQDMVKKSMLVNSSLIMPEQYDKLREGLAETIKLPYELRKLNLEADALVAAAAGDVSAADKQKLEDSYRGEYTKSAAPYKAMQEAMSSIFASASLANPAGDVALVTQFRKLLDPTSVVRESEFAQTAEAGGLITKLQAELSKVSGTGLIAQETRDQIVTLGRELMRKADAYERRRREDIDYRADKYGLDKKAIYGVGVAGEMPSDLPDYPNMTDEQRARVNPLTIKTPEELRFFIDSQRRALEKLKGGQ